MNSLRLEPISSVAGVVNLPGSKSVSNRALLLAALWDRLQGRPQVASVSKSAA